MANYHYPEACPSCGGKYVARIEFGLPDLEALARQLDAGKVILGGCDVSIDSPQWHCSNCSHEWGTTEWAPHLRETEKQRKDKQSAKDAEADARGVLVAEIYPDGDVVCPHCKRTFTTNYSMSWDGSRHKSCGTYLKLMPKASNA